VPSRVSHPRSLEAKASGKIGSHVNTEAPFRGVAGTRGGDGFELCAESGKERASIARIGERLGISLMRPHTPQGFAANRVSCEVVALAWEPLARAQMLALADPSRRWEPKPVRLRVSPLPDGSPAAAAACDPASPNAGHGLATSPPRSPACKPSRPAEQAVQAPARVCGDAQGVHGLARIDDLVIPQL
jgi:hypothetical protein